MGYGFMAYAVDLDAARKAFGSKDENLLAVVIESQDLEDEEDDDDDEDDEVSLPTALRQIIMGERFDKDSAHQYGYAFKELCGHHGEFLPNDMMCGTGSEFNDILDKVLDRLKVPAKLFRVNDHLVNRKDPVPLPKRDDFPYIGHLTADEAKAVAAALSALDPDAVTEAASGFKTRRGAIEPGDVAEYLTEIADWCQTCADGGRALVTFYH